MDGEHYTGKTVLVVGAARSGVAAARFLLARGARVILTDMKTREQLQDAVAQLESLPQARGNLRLDLGRHEPEAFAGCDLVVESPGVPLSMPMFDISRRAGIPIVGEVELAWRHLRGKVLAITGSNGKTTTTTLTAALLTGSGLKGHAAGNIGIPLIGLAEGSKSEDIFVIEMSSFQLESIDRFRPDAAAILNLTPDHLDRYPDFEAYARAKERIFLNQERRDFAVLNRDDLRTADVAGRIRSGVLWFSRKTEPAAGTFVRGGLMYFRGTTGEETALFAVEDVAIKGAHNLENVLAACALALAAGARADSLRETVRSFRGVEHRLEWVAEISGVQYFNDSKATNVDAAIKSLESFAGGVHLIAGGKDKGGDFTALILAVKQRVREIVLIGEAAGKIREALTGVTELADAATLAEALAVCRRRALPGDVVLLAPACASFDMFDNYEHRGRVFKDAVRALKSES
jgi:UDP-N-acetylmuramoylalanine--D-glutamate ligase